MCSEPLEIQKRQMKNNFIFRNYSEMESRNRIFFVFNFRKTANNFNKKFFCGIESTFVAERNMYAEHLKII